MNKQQNIKKNMYVCLSFFRGYSCYRLSAILKGKLKSFQHFLWMALLTCPINFVLVDMAEVNTQMKVNEK